MDRTCTVELDSMRADLCARIDALLDEMLTTPEGPQARLHEAIRYAAIGGGKRLRPLLVLISSRLFDVPEACALRAGLAVECIHAHSLIHDDLPCMDDDDLRRGKPTVHRAFDEATAVLAGDALLAFAFEILADPATHEDGEVRANLVASLARAAGMAGMAGGQMIDVLAPGLSLDLEAVAELQKLKTGALLAWSVEAGAILGGATPEQIYCLDSYSACLGVAFQIADDLLDANGEEAKTGKRVGKDEGAGKQTFVSLLGPDRARHTAIALAEEAKCHLAPFGEEADPLRAIADFAVARDH
ncbi:MAG TPA: farnesyl diphosphate synthase [Allosphingosinicella sp.]|jgi:farnesyl diphosphate synthase